MHQRRTFSYVGGELDLFFGARNWKRYWSSRVRPLVSGDVLDVGAGIGATFDYLEGAASTWTCLEPDDALCARLQERLARHPRQPRVLSGTVSDLDPDERFDTILYIDVLEHIEQDEEEVRAAAARLRPQGSLIVLAPALMLLYSPFDAGIGHYRRYSRRSLAALTPPGFTVATSFYLDGVGVATSLFARIARRANPTRSQIEAWDRVIVPASRVTDVLTSRFFGRSVVVAWKPAAS